MKFEKHFELSPIEQILPASDVIELQENIVQIYKICNHLESVCNTKKIYVLAANKVGVPLKILVKKNHNFFDYYLNCYYQNTGRIVKSLESCPWNQHSLIYEVSRFDAISLSGYKLIVDPELHIVKIDEQHAGKDSIIFQQEIDVFQGQEKLLKNTGIPIELI